MTSTETNQALDGLAAMAHAQYAAVLRDTAFGPTLPYADLPHVHREAWRAGAGAVARASTVGHDLVVDFHGDRPLIVVLCGSTRFVEEFNRQRKLLTEAGHIVLSIEVVTTQAREVDPQHADPGLKRRLDELHKRKIDLADRVLVLDVGGYIGESTRSEVDYAEQHGKPVAYLSQEMADA